MLGHQIKVAQALVSAFLEGDVVRPGHHFRISLKSLSSFMNMKDHHFVVVSVRS